MEEAALNQTLKIKQKVVRDINNKKDTCGALLGIAIIRRNILRHLLKEEVKVSVIKDDEQAE